MSASESKPEEQQEEGSPVESLMQSSELVQALARLVYDAEQRTLRQDRLRSLDR